jgi:NitT/TauT family transport system substrate-binding protein
MRESIRKTVLFLFLASFAGLAAGAQERLVFTPQWTPQAQFAGYYVAYEKGFYREVGLDVDIVHPSSTEPAIARIITNKSQATTLQLCQAMEIIDNGVPVVNILQTSMNNALVIVSREDRDPLEQKGMRVGTWSVGFDQMAICLSLKEGLDYQWIHFTSCLNLFLTGAIDAAVAMSYNEYYQLLQAGVEMTDRNVYRFCDHGYNVQEDGVYMTREYYEKHRDQARRFAEASRRGWEWAAAHPEETLDIVMDYVNRNHIATNRVMQKLMLGEVLRLQVNRETGEREFRLRPDMVRLASSLMLENQLLFHEVTYDELLDR